MEYLLDEIQDVSVSKVVKWIAASAMIFGGVVAYVPQYWEIQRLENADGFSLHVCLALLVANTLRILFWFGKRYEFPLLMQSIIMNIAMMLMIRLCVHIKGKHQAMKGKDRVFTDFDSRYFWAWTDFQSYMDFMLMFSVVGCFLVYSLFDSPVFIELVGFLAVFTEAMLGMPQLLQNHRNKSTQGMSVSMVLMWTCGDVFKTCYFIAREAPSQFWMCGALQVAIDLIILLQVRAYRANVVASGRKD